MKGAKKTITIVLSVILWVIILLAALFAFTTLATRDSDSVSSLAGFTPLTIKSDSMSPTFNKGDMIIIKKCDPNTLEVGDIITFHTIIENQYVLNTHKIAAISDVNGVRSYTTKGDNNPVEDSSLVTNGDIVGKYVQRVPGLGKVMEFLSTSVGFLCVIVLPVLVFFIYQIYHLVMVGIQLKKAVAIEQAEELAKAGCTTAVVTSDEAAEKLAQAEAALAEAKRLKEEAEAKLSEANSKEEKKDETEQ